MSRYDNAHLMWAHYGAVHKGFVIGFNTQHKFFTSEDRELKCVTYQPTTPSFNREQDPDGSIFTTKSDKWTYEGEWRCLQPTSPDTNEEEIFVDIDLDTPIINTIIMGYKHDDALLRRIREACWKNKLLDDDKLKWFRSQPARVNRFETLYSIIY